MTDDDAGGPQTPPEPRPPNSLVTQLKLRVQALTDRMDAFEDVRGEVAAVAEAIEELGARQKESKPAPIWWPGHPGGHDQDLREHQWDEFTMWLQTVLAGHYPTDARKLTPCWAQHHATVDALTSLWLTWQAAYLNRAADARDAASWHVQWRPQLIEVAAGPLSECRGAGEHRELVALAPDLLRSLEPVHDQ